ncbi:MAG TPA: AAA family ATPase, partial [Acidimicrobiales bacterium]|nr:AAA family ATPase [Acidimicrobiales bacterium]
AADAATTQAGPPASADQNEAADLLRARILLRGRSVADGASFILDAPTEVPTVWGAGGQVWWAKGEELIICGPPGVGKTTIAQQAVLARIGLRDELLGLPVEPEEHKVLYIAADRPAQAQRSFARMVTEADRQVVADKLVVWRGPLPFDLAKEPRGLLILAEEMGAGTVVIDSLKDVALDLSSDETGSRLNNSVQIALAEGVEVVALHHQRKSQQGGGKPKSLADLYGSVWIGAGAGSVMLVWGEPGDPLVEVSHLKQPNEEVGPHKVAHDHARGVSTIEAPMDLVEWIRCQPEGTTAMDAAMRLFETGGPSRPQVAKARRRLDALVDDGRLERLPGRRGGQGGAEGHRYRVATIEGMRGS